MAIVTMVTVTAKSREAISRCMRGADGVGVLCEVTASTGFGWRRCLYGQRSKTALFQELLVPITEVARRPIDRFYQTREAHRPLGLSILSAAACHLLRADAFVFLRMRMSVAQSRGPHALRLNPRAGGYPVAHGSAPACWF
jgi:hypothetical protein